MGVLAMSGEPSSGGSGSALVPRPVSLLGEALGTPAQLRHARSLGGRAAASSAPGVRLERLPTDWGLKRSLVISSLGSLEWCETAGGSVVDGEAMRAACRGDAASLAPPPDRSDATGEHTHLEKRALAVRMRAALLSWRHPAQRLPPMVSKQLASADAGVAEAAYVRSLRDQWQAALRSLYHDLREGRRATARSLSPLRPPDPVPPPPHPPRRPAARHLRTSSRPGLPRPPGSRLPYFYALHDAWSLLWRNGALSPDEQPASSPLEERAPGCGRHSLPGP